jgi:hypothetical protein
LHKIISKAENLAPKSAEDGTARPAGADDRDWWANYESRRRMIAASKVDAWSRQALSHLERESPEAIRD